MTLPNILYLHSHDTGRFIQPFGHAVPTPRLQQLAEQGVLFRQCFCAGPTCSPSRAALLTGQWPHNNGMVGLAHRGSKLYDYGRHIVNTLKPAGYTTHLCGVQHVAPDAAMIGYDKIHDTQRNSPEEAAAAFLDGYRAQQPFFLSVGFFQTHRDFPEHAPEDDPRYTMPPPCLPDTPETRKDMADFKTIARDLDTRMGSVLDALDRNGLAQDTLVICTTDHGIAFPRMKCNLYDAGIGVMLIIRGPGGFTGGKVVDALVSHIDIFPTVCELLGIDRPGWLQGESMMPLIRGERDEIRDAVFAEVNYHAAYEPMRCVRTRRYKYIRRYGDRLRPIMANCDNSPSKTLWMEQGWLDSPHDGEELYDLVFDPNEACNLAEKPEAAEILTEMQLRLDRWMQQTDDPLLRGFVEPWEGMIVNDAGQEAPHLEHIWKWVRAPWAGGSSEG